MKEYKESFFYLIGKIVPAVTSLLIIYFGLKLFGKEGYGKFNLLYNSAILVSAFFAGWLQQSFLRFLSAKDQIEPIFLITSVSSFLAFVIQFFICLLYFEISSQESLIVSFFAGIYTLFIVLLTYQQAKFKSKIYIFSEGLFYSLAVVLAASFYLSELNRSIYSFFWSLIISGLMISIYLLSKSILKTKVLSIPDQFRSFLSFGMPLTAWLFLSFLFNIVDRYFINVFQGYTSTGIYSSVYDVIYKAVSFCCMPLLLSFHPKITSLYNRNDRREVIKSIEKVVLAEIALVIVLLIVLIAASDIIFNSILGLNEPNLLLIIIPLIISAGMWQVSLFVHKVMELLLLRYQMIAGIVLSLLINVILNYIFIPIYSYYASAWITLISTLVYLFYISWFYFRNKKLWIQPASIT